MNILILPSWYPDEPNGVYGAFFREQAIALHNNGNKVIVLNGTFTGIKDCLKNKCKVITRQSDSGLIIYRKMIPSIAFSRSVSVCTTIFRRRIYELLKVFEKENPELKIDIIHAHSCYPAGFIACEIGKKKGIPVIITEHRSNYMREKIPKAHIKLINKCINNSSCFICVGEGLRKNLIKNCECKEDAIRVLGNMVSDLFVYKGDYLLDKDRFFFISVGGLIPRKRHEQLIRCFSIAFKDKPNVCLKIIGEGSERKRLEALIHEFYMDTRITLLGRKERTEVASEMQSSNAFVLTSKTETFGVVYTEALACGLPVLGTRNGGADDIVSDYNGILVDVDKDEQLITALLNMFEKCSDYDRLLISRKALEAYSGKSITSRLQSIYAEAIAGNSF